MKTKHQFFFSDSRNMSDIENESVDLIVTSPPYPMIQMWDCLFGNLNNKINSALNTHQTEKAFELMHKELDKTWAESYRVLKKGGFACINIGDATQTQDSHFQLYSNHSCIISAFRKLGWTVLPIILWHKKANTPNKFMGSGMLPAGAYVTLEHEYILIFRKGDKRQFKTEQEKALRRRSAFFWEERNKWFSDIWFDLPGVTQNISKSLNQPANKYGFKLIGEQERTITKNHKSLRTRSAAFPLDLAYRLICMYSVQSDTVLDPFGGIGTTTLSSIATGRNSVSIEIEKSFQGCIGQRLRYAQNEINRKTTQRLLDHIEFIKDYTVKKGRMKYKSSYYGFPVMTKQETDIQIPYVESMKFNKDKLISVNHCFVSETRSITGRGKTQNSHFLSQQNNYKQMEMRL